MEAVFNFLQKYIVFERIELGSLSSWVSGLLTALGIYISIRESQPKIKIIEKIDNENFNLTIINNSNYEINLDLLYIIIYKNRCNKKLGPLLQMNEFFQKDEKGMQIPRSFDLKPKKAINHGFNFHDLKVQFKNNNAEEMLSIFKGEMFYLDYTIHYSGRTKTRKRIKIKN